MMRDYAEYTKSFEACTIDAATFTHLDHLGVAYVMLGKDDFMTVCSKYGQCIKTIAGNAGASAKFNTTMTIAFLAVIAERMESGRYQSFEAFTEANQDLLDGKVLEQWYTRDRLHSDLARTTFLLPGVVGG